MTVTEILVVAAAFTVAGVVKGAIGMGLPPIALAVMTFAVPLEDSTGERWIMDYPNSERQGGGPPAAAARGSGIPSAPPGGRPAPTPRVTVTNGNSAVATITPNTPGVAHVILAVTDNGEPALTSYRRVILTIQSASR